MRTAAAAHALIKRDASETPRTDAVLVEGHTQQDVCRLLAHARQLERDLAESGRLNQILNRENQAQLQLRKDAEARK